MLESEDEEKTTYMYLSWPLGNIIIASLTAANVNLIVGFGLQLHSSTARTLPDLQCQDAWTDIGAFLQSISLPIRDLRAS